MSRKIYNLLMAVKEIENHPSNKKPCFITKEKKKNTPWEMRA